MLLLLAIQVECALDPFEGSAFAVRRLAVAMAAVFLLVDVAGSTALRIGQIIPSSESTRKAYTSVELLLSLTGVDLRYKVN